MTCRLPGREVRNPYDAARLSAPCSWKKVVKKHAAARKLRIQSSRRRCTYNLCSHDHAHARQLRRVPISRQAAQLDGRSLQLHIAGATVKASYELEYGSDSIEMHADAITEGQRVVLIDDLVATGGTLAAGAHPSGSCSIFYLFGVVSFQCNSRHWRAPAGGARRRPGRHRRQAR